MVLFFLLNSKTKVAGACSKDLSILKKDLSILKKGDFFAKKRGDEAWKLENLRNMGRWEIGEEVQ